ncbi:MAG: hypothetical protein A2X86_19670 [Bdellovibrionales bacterium GWA2_49_15]|nr:MAG: hypothetical protein A2X86_19670 [Bdellovibrionales bacterium GWA2_49_15]HAZ13789.1 hypothetical protein [Bdellovibrionales bacterium]
MNSDWQRSLSAIVLGFGGIMILYLSFKFTGDGLPHSSPLMLPWNILDFVVIKVLYFLLYAVPVAGVLFLIHLYIMEMIDRRYDKTVKEVRELKENFEWKIQGIDKRFEEASKKQEQEIDTLLKEIKIIKDDKEAKARLVSTIEEQTLKNFL